MIKNIKWLLLVSLSFVACNNDDDETTAEVPVTAGSANFSTYVALGDSFAAGYSDGALFKKGQENSYPNILAGQFAQAGGGVFTTPFCGDDNKGGLLFSGNTIQGTRLYFNGVGPTPVAGPVVTEVLNHLSGTFSNLGVPGAKSFHLLAAGYGNAAGVPGGLASPYFSRFSSSASTTILADALSQNPTFFSLWIGGNDVLGYATGGGVTTTESASTGSNITPDATFDGAYNSLATQLAAGGKKGVVANLPYVSTLPYFTRVPYNPVTLNAAQVAQLNSGFASYNGGLAFAVANLGLSQAEADRRKVVFVVGKNPVIIVDNYLTNLTPYSIPSYRPATAEDFLVLPSSSFIGTLVGGNPAAINGVSVPLADKWVLSKDEAAEIKAATDHYNITIEAAANTNGLAFVDAKAIMDQLVNGGIRFGNYHMSATYVTGGAFSLDGIHPGARGYALIANKFLEAINAKYGSTLRPVDLGNYQIQYPASL
ncbi:GDSL-like Lipase/Acylhydrolase [Flavobacterium swingsii]|jgi:lysophospholipase L1-like esterase|uniref:GDSL-like Lipase/Acylhydrolase n=1 Tax=Flavobacterium swingsii TaxID=498292 RepID=A0A1I0XG04_9FLAO|nr:SGNH/GDSL hydrolase family protein [Flavobacterium swingsii]SFA99965.1 GDSL-like Lipase/Acylhydrolase [Flavobacterium swingsii]